MNSLEMKILCRNCPRQKLEIESSGEKNGVEYVTFKSTPRYIIEDNPNISWDEIIKNRDKFVWTYVPKFGKYEIEEFVGYELMKALLITRDITGLFNSELLCDDSPFNVTRVRRSCIKERLMKCFDVIEDDTLSSDIVKLVFKWKPWSELQ